jgi:hypothetical protein
MKAFLCELLFSCMLAAPGVKPIDELTYGTVLYAYYQQDYQQALLDTLVAEQQGRQGDDTVRFELAKGSFAFADGMYAYARETFAGVESSELTKIDEMRLAFHLAREYHRRGDYDEVAGNLEKIDLGKNMFGRSKFHPEVEFMRAEVAMQAQDFASAEAALGKMDKEDPLRAYGLFNLGVAYRSAQNLEGAKAAFADLTGMKTDSGEAADLIQRAKLALAFIAREQNQVADAEAVLGGLPGSGRYRDIALASYGGLAMDNEDYELAARIWLTLQNQQYWTTSTAQARLGFPVSLEKLASREMALVQYRAAEQGFENRLTKLTDLNERARDPEWVHGLLLAFSAPKQNSDQMTDLMESWQDQLGHTDWLEWLATEDVHEVLLQWRELLGMRSWLDELPRRLDAYGELSTEQVRRGTVARDLLYDHKLLENRDLLTQNIRDLAGQIDRVKGEMPTPDGAWMRMLANLEEQELIDKFENMRRLARTHMTERERDKWQERISRLQGVLFWRLVDERSARTRALEKSLGENRLVLADVNDRIARVQGAEDRYVASVQTDFLAFAQRAEGIAARVDDALRGREESLAAEIRRGMQREMREVREYLLVARIAIARATDLLAQTDDGSATLDAAILNVEGGGR